MPVSFLKESSAFDWGHNTTVEKYVAGMRFQRRTRTAASNWLVTIAPSNNCTVKFRCPKWTLLTARTPPGLSPEHSRQTPSSRLRVGS
jgi:hypothetical protein